MSESPPELQTNAINLQDRVAVITGGAQGIGFALARRSLQSRARLVLWDVSDAGLKNAVAELGAERRVRGERVDIANLAEAEAAVENAARLDGRIDI